MSRRILPALAFGLLVPAAAAFAATPEVEAQAVPVSYAAALPRSAVLTDVRSAFVEGDRIGSVHGGADCTASNDRGWSELIRHRVEAEAQQAFREELAKAQATAEPTGAKAAPLKVHAFVNNIDVEVCQASAGAWQGGFYVQVGWQIVAPDTGRVVYQASTEGSFTQATPKRASTAASLRQAFGMAVRNLLSDRRFTAMLQQNGQRFALADPI
jgi:hypothetical protein